MFAKRLLYKLNVHSQGQINVLMNLDLEITAHYGIPTGPSILAFDHVQSLLAIGSLDGRIKVIGGDNIEGLLIPPRQSPYKYLEFLQNLGFLVSISNDNYIQVWNLETRSIAGSLHWQSNITAFTVVVGSHFMYIGDETGTMSVLKYEVDGEVLLRMPYYISSNSLEVAPSSVLDQQPIVGLLTQPCSAGKRVLIAYENGLMVLWDVVETRTIAIRGNKVLQLKEKLAETSGELHNNISELDFEGKEISAICWASNSGRILAVGYVDGDIILWRIDAPKGGKHDDSHGCHIVKLQLSPSNRKLPVIVLCWSSDVKSNDGDGQLFVYGGCEIGSEVITVLSLHYSSKTKVLGCSRRIDLTLKSPFVDMNLLPAIHEKGNAQNATLFILTTSGKMHYFDDSICSNSISRGEERILVSSVEIPEVIPTDHPHMTVAKLYMLPSGGDSSNALSKIASLANGTPKVLCKGARWPLRGGISDPIILSRDREVKRVYVAGYEDGSIRMWDATYSVFTLLFHLESKVATLSDIQSNVDCSSASISQMDFCFLTLNLAVGCESGLVQIYNFSCSSSNRNFHFVTQSKHEVKSLLQGKWDFCEAVFFLNCSSIRALKFTSSGANLLVGYDSGEVAVLDMKSYTILSLTGVQSVLTSQVVSIASKPISHSDIHIRNPKDEGSKVPNDSEDDLIFVLTNDTNVCVLRKSVTGINSSQPLLLKKTATALSICIIEFRRGICGLSNKEQDDGSSSNEPFLKKAFGKTDQKPTSENMDFSESSKDSLLLLCCKETIRLYHLETILQGKRKYIAKVKLAKPCCWAATFKKDQMVAGLVLIFHNGDFEIRSLPELELIKQGSLQSTLRWSFQENIERRISSTEDGLIALVNGCELAFISLSDSEDNLRLPNSFPSLHDRVLAAMPDPSYGEKQSKGSKLFGASKGSKADITNSSDYSHLEDIFSRDPFSEFMSNEKSHIELDIDDIKIDEPASPATYSNKNSRNKKGKTSVNGPDADTMPKLQTYEEVISKYRKRDPSAIEEARNKLIERQHKLEMLGKKTEDLKTGAEDFHSLAEELVKVMKERKPWHY